MIFLSHNFRDKPVIEQIAEVLRNTFGQDRVFYDSWSIQPGDGIIDKMESGLKACRFFFFFVSENSLKSPMVRLEWQNALMKASANESIKFIPVRLDRSELPFLLTQTLHIDLFSTGLDAATRQVIDVASERNTYSATKNSFSNLQIKVSTVANSHTFSIEAKHFMEPISSFLFVFTNALEEVSLIVHEEPAFKAGAISNVTVAKQMANGKTIGLDRALTPGHPLVVKAQTANDAPLDLITVMHECAKGEWAPV